LGYIQLNIDLHLRDLNWWWKWLWKVSFPLKSKILMWCILNKKPPTQEVMEKRSIEVLGWCSLCKSSGETSAHLFLLCPFIKVVWKECPIMLGQVWSGLFSARNESGDIIKKCTEILHISNNITEIYQRCNHKHRDTVIHDFY
jgi:hypothetical protein